MLSADWKWSRRLLMRRWRLLLLHGKLPLERLHPLLCIPQLLPCISKPLLECPLLLLRLLSQLRDLSLERRGVQSLMSLAMRWNRRGPQLLSNSLHKRLMWKLVRTASEIELLIHTGIVTGTAIAPEARAAAVAARRHGARTCGLGG